MIFNLFKHGRRMSWTCAAALIAIIATVVIARADLRSRHTSPRKLIASVPAIRPSGHRSGQTHFDLLAKLLADNRRGKREPDVLRAARDPESKYRVDSETHPLLDNPAPLITLLDSDGQAWDLDEKRQLGPVVLVFYLNYGCDACVTGLFELNADFQMFQALGAQVAAISDDPAELTQSRFKRYGKFSFPVLSDPGHRIAALYSIYHEADLETPEKLLHGTFVIGQDHQVIWAQTGNAPFSPNTAVLYELARINQRQSEASGEKQ